MSSQHILPTLAWMFFCFRTTLVDKRCNYFGLRVYTLRSIRPRFVLFCLFVCFYSFTVHLSDSQPNSFLSSSKLYRQEVDGVGGGGGVYSWEFLVGVCRPDLQTLTLFQTKNVIFDTRFQTWPVKYIPQFLDLA